MCRLAASHSCIVTLEENVVAGGAGSAVSECLAAHGIERAVHHIGIPDRFIEHGSREDCLAMAGLDAAGIARAGGATLAGASPPCRWPAAGGRPGAALTMDSSRERPRRHRIDDVQGRADSRQIPINKVGIKDIYHPVRVRDRPGGEQHTVANFNMYVALPHNFKGTHMSRFVEVLHQHEREISVESFRADADRDDRGASMRPPATSR